MTPNELSGVIYGARHPIQERPLDEKAFPAWSDGRSPRDETASFRRNDGESPTLSH